MKSDCCCLFPQKALLLSTSVAAALSFLALCGCRASEASFNHFSFASGSALLLQSLSLHAAPVSEFRPAPLQMRAAAGNGRSTSAFVHLFEWKWTDIAQECETFLGPHGFAAVQISPPQESAVVEGFPWYQRYKPVSYKLESRSGTRAELADMVTRCKNAGVLVYADVVINHMATTLKPGQNATGNAGTGYGRYSFPGLYSNVDFHHCGRYGDDVIQNYQDRWEVQNCELLGLSDLDTGSDYVRGRIADYLDDLTGLGVAGFRFDAAKHIATDDLRAILRKLTGKPFLYQEVIDQGGEPITASEYLQNGNVTEFKASLSLGNVFYSGKLSSLQNFGPQWGFVPAEGAIVFTDNHDNQRGHGGGGNVVTFKDPTLHDLANVFLLAWPYGYTQIMSSYEFRLDSQGPPSDAQGNTKSVYTNGKDNCFGEWVCEHRRPAITGMLGFRKAAGKEPVVANWWSNGNNAIAFSRGRKGFVVVNKEPSLLSRSFQTGLPRGSYCDVVAGEVDRDAKKCTGQTIAVDDNGIAKIDVEARTAVAIHVGALLTSTEPEGIEVKFDVESRTQFGENLFVTGSVPEMGVWDPTLAIGFENAAYPEWKASVFLKPGAPIEYKYLKKDGAGRVVWESGVNRAVGWTGDGTQPRPPEVQDVWRSSF